MNNENLQHHFDDVGDHLETSRKNRQKILRAFSLLSFLIRHYDQMREQLTFCFLDGLECTNLS